MDIKGKTVLVIGGWGLVGSAICRKFMDDSPRRMIVTSLSKEEAMDAAVQLRKEFPRAEKNFFVPWWGNIFVRHQFKDMSREEILSDAIKRSMFIEDIVDELTPGLLKRSSLYKLMMEYKPHVVVDCVNSATAIAYQDIFQVSRDLMKQIRAARSRIKYGNPRSRREELIDSAERLLCTLYVPQLIRHVQLMYRSMSDARTKIYVKIGTSGTGGMGLNIPYTHSEERPSRVLLSKSAVAGAHTLLLFLMGRTPDAPITKEVKPAAAIAWKRIAFGEIKKRGKPIELVDCPPRNAVRLNGKLQLSMRGVARKTGGSLQSVFIDTGENGIFSRGEFEAISTPGQMEFVTPEEIADCVVFEVKAGNTGHDIINALDNATLAPTYRAGFMFSNAMTQMQTLEQEHGAESVAFEMLGPPRLSKLLYEAYLFKRAFSNMHTVVKTESRILSQTLTDLIREDETLRSHVISIGIPILLPDGKSLLRGPMIKIPAYRGEQTLPISPASIDQWARDGWVDLRLKNMERWRARFRQIIREVEQLSEEDSSSRTMHNREYWKNLTEIDPGKVCGWLFTYEEKGKRMKA